MNKKEKWECATMEIIQEEKNGIVCLTVKGRMEAQLSPELERTIKEIIASDRSRLLLDLSALDYLRSSVLRVILNAIKEINQKSGKVVLCCLSGYVKEIFEINRFKDTVAIADSVESGIKELLNPLKAA
jgi:anti-anti-sigma factor